MDELSCKDCGGQFKFDPKSRALKCPNCGQMQEIVIKRAVERPFEEAEQIHLKNRWESEAKTIRCSSCGAVEILNKGDLSDICPFCGNTTIVDVEELTNTLIPNAIMPFTITEKEAHAAMRNKIKKAAFAPSDFKKTFKIRCPKGIYTPVYSFDADASTFYSGTVNKQRQNSYTDSEGHTHTETVTYTVPVSGLMDLRVDDTLIDAGQNISSTILSKLEPFNTNSSISYDKRFLQGFVANKSQKDITIARNQLDEIVKQKFEEKIISKYNASSANLSYDLTLNHLMYKYILIPVYTNGYVYKNKTYNLYCNGTTSKIAGRTPISRVKVWATVLGVLALVGGVIAAITILF